MRALESAMALSSKRAALVVPKWSGRSHHQACVANRRREEGLAGAGLQDEAPGLRAASTARQKRCSACALVAVRISSIIVLKH